LADYYYDQDIQTTQEIYSKALSLEIQKESDYYNIYGKTEIEDEIVIRPTNSLAWQTAILKTLYNYVTLIENTEDISR
jgi:hypothetical protein